MIKYSILHTTARESWALSFEAWMASAAYPEQVEYILAIDERWPVDYFQHSIPESYRYNLRVAHNWGRKCMVDGYQAAYSAQPAGAVLILNSDDMRPEPEWDLKLTAAIGDRDGLTEDFVVHVDSGTHADARDLMVCQILSAARAARLGYVLYPGYESMYADDDFSEHARHDGVVIDARRLIFPHLHPATWEPLDTVYQHQNRIEAYEWGSKLLQLRRMTGFGTGPPATQHIRPMAQVTRKRSIAICVPGDVFSGVWFANFINLFSELVSNGYIVHCFTNYSSNVYITRRCILEGLKRMTEPLDYILWIDDDNTPNWGHVSGMIADLDTYPEVGMVTGWCWIQPDGYEIRPIISCGYFEDPKTYKGVHLTEQAMASLNGLGLIDWSGFPTMVMRGAIARDLPVTAFDPRPAPGNRWGFTGEDVSFCITAREAGYNLYVDSRMEIPHYKLRPAKPNMPGTLKAEEIGEVVPA